ncbi:MAG TPA: Sec-independent protein translocase protein TatB [Candidatus Omnitrophota bacterium]|nr:Sec-independent protein translocase protein TatB [Candidatus Omnitrophota bacterium]
MFNIGMPELLVILVVALLVMGPKRLPDLARQIGKLTVQLKRAAMDLRQAVEQEPPADIQEEVREKLGKQQDEESKPA